MVFSFLCIHFNSYLRVYRDAFHQSTVVLTLFFEVRTNMRNCGCVLVVMIRDAMDTDRIFSSSSLLLYCASLDLINDYYCCVIVLNGRKEFHSNFSKNTNMYSQRRSHLFWLRFITFHFVCWFSFCNATFWMSIWFTIYN